MPTLLLSLDHVIVPIDFAALITILAAATALTSICKFEVAGVVIVYVYGSDSALSNISRNVSVFTSTPSYVSWPTISKVAVLAIAWARFLPLGVVALRFTVDDPKISSVSDFGPGLLRDMDVHLNVPAPHEAAPLDVAV
jgi:hypothetical protein